MKNKTSTIVFLTILAISLTGCSKYEKDESYSTDLYGTYSQNVETLISDDVNDETKYSYYLYEKYEFNDNNTYQYTVKEIIYDDITKDNSDIGKILSTEEISDDITKITLGQEITGWSTNETSNKTIYKYKNMLGSFYEIEVPKGKTFELRLNDYAWFDEEGQYHLCNNDNCECDTSSPKYVRKDNIIYFQSMDEEHKDCYTIGMYIVENGIFIPKLNKEN